MKNLVPHFIVENFKNSVFKGNFEAVTMFVDISGFTKMTETLMESGEEGAEILSKILNKIFNPIVSAIYLRNGFISTFAGDAFTAIFQNKVSEAIFTSQKIQVIFNRQSLQKTKFGNFELSVKIGLSFGKVDWAILGKKQKTYFFKGKAIDFCAFAEHKAQKGEIVFDKNLPVKHEKIAFEKIDKNYSKLLSVSQKEEKLKKNKLSRLPKKVIEKFFPKEVIDFNKTGEFRNAASVFISFETENPDDFVSVVLENIKHFSGYFNKLDFGDKGGIIFCVFGAPTAFEKNIERTLDFVLSLKADLSKIPVKERFSITYGTVYAGIIGGKERCEYTIIGDVVNLSARFVMQANSGEILVSERIAKTLENNYEFEFLGDFNFKGKSQKLPVFSLKGKKEVLKKFFSGKLVGRKKELELAKQPFELLKKQISGGILYVYGEAGIGKSRFVSELKTQNQGLNWFYLPCDGILKKAFNPFLYFFVSFFEQSAENSNSENKANFEKNYDRILSFAGELKAELMRLKSVLAGFLGIFYANSLYEQLDSKLRYENTLYSFKEFFKALSLEKSIVLELQDIHWIDLDTVKALEIICKGTEKFPILIVATSRYNDDKTKPKLPLLIASTEIDLNVFSSDFIREFSEINLKGRISEPLLKTLEHKTQGNPFFIEQTLFYFRETKIISFENEVWELLKEESVIPSGINDLLLARIDRLPYKLREVVQTASVLGMEFNTKLLTTILNQRNIESYLKEGETQNIWSIFAEIKCIFSHALFRDAVYGMQLKERLRKLHKVVAETIERLFPEQKEFYFDVAFHYEKAEVSEKMIEFFEKAGDFAKETYKNKLAIEFYNKLLVKLEHSGNFEGLKIDVLLKKGDVLRLIGEWNEAEKIFGEVFLLAEKISDKKRTASSQFNLGLLYCGKNLYSKGMEFFQKSLLNSQKADDKKGIAISVGGIGIVHHNLGNYEKAMECYKEQLKISKEIGDKIGITKATGNIGLVHKNKCDYDKAIEVLTEAAVLSDELGDKKAVSTVLGNLGSVYFQRGDYEKTIYYFKKDLEISEKLGDKNDIAKAIGNLGACFWVQKNYEKSKECFEKDLSLSEELGDKNGIARAIGNLGAFYFVKKYDLEKAKKYFIKNLKISKEIGEKNSILHALTNLGTVFSEQGKCKKAMSIFLKSLQLSEEIGEKREIAIILRNIAEIYRQNKQFEKSLEFYEKAIAISKELKIYEKLIDCLNGKIEVLILLENYKQAKIVNDEALVIAKEFKENLFLVNFYQVKISFWISPSLENFEKLQKLIEICEEERQKAIVSFELWEMAKKIELAEKIIFYQKQTLQFYQKFNQQNPKNEFREKIQKLLET
ncbi:tetratricopeptide repeat protein [bacterium]|nr:tetratricopeptide repeat protein [bacterium]